MKTVVIIRGIPGTGKSTVVKQLADMLAAKGYIIDVLSVDTFKLNSEANTFRERCVDAYKKTADYVQQFLKNKDESLLIVEEIFYDPLLIKTVREIENNPSVNLHTFLLERPMEELLEVEAGRKRDIKNSYEDLLNLDKKMRTQKISDEEVIKNTNSFETSERIAQKLLDSEL